MNPDEQELVQALAAADAAGDTGAATKIATAIRTMRERARLQTDQIGEMSGFDKIATGVGRGMNDVGQGVKQLGLQMGEKFNALPGPARAALSVLQPGLAMNLGKDQPETAAAYTGKVQDELATYEPLKQDSPWLTGGGRLVGNIAAMPLPAGAGATLPARMGSAALAGGAQGAVQFVPEGGSRIANTAIGATVGALIPGILKAGSVTVGAVKTLAGKLKDALPPMTQAAREQMAAKMLRDAAANPATLANAGQAQSAVPGVLQSLAESTDDAGIAGLQRTMRSMSPELNNRLGMTEQANNVARVEAVRGAFGGADESAARAIEQTRNQVALPLLRQAEQVVGVNVNPVVQLADRIVRSRDGRPAVQSAVQKVRDLLVRDVAPEDRARNALAAILEARGRKMSSADFATVKEAATIVRRVASGALSEDDALKALKAFKPGSVVAQRAIKSGRDLLSTQTRNVDDIHRLYNARQTIDDMLKGSAGADSDAARAAARELMTIKGSLDNQMRKVSDEFGDYLKKFSGMSREAGQVRMGAELLEKSFANADAAGNPVLSPAKFSMARRDLDRVAQQATGFRKQTAERLMTPEQLQTVQAVGGDLERFARSQVQGKAVGSNTTQNLAGMSRVQDAALGGDELRAALLPQLSGAMSILNGFRRKAGEKVLSIVQEALVDPARAPALMRTLTAAQRQQVATALQNQQLRQALEVLRIAGPSTTAAAVVGGPEQQ